jgi:type I restriction enzyme S subunit
MNFKQAEVGLVPENWAVEELSAFCSLITYGFTNPMPDADKGPWKLTAKDVVDGRINYDTARRTTQDAFDRLTDKSRPRLGDVLLTKDGSIGRVAVVDREGICINQSVALIRPNERIAPDFLKFLLSSPHYQKVMEGDSDGSTIKHIYITRVDKMQVAVPPVEEQIKFLLVIKSIDDRINLLRETNQTLEAIVQALFKSWFVDFDPVRAKAEGRVPDGIDVETAALFPDKFDEDETGLVPTGWEVKNFLEFIERQPVGKKFDQKTALTKGVVPILDQGKSGIIGFHNESAGVKASLENPVVVFANHTCYMRLICFDFSAIQNVLPFTGKQVDTIWAYYATKDRIKFSEYKGHWPDFAIEKAVVPPEILTKLYKEAVSPLVNRIQFNELQANTLSNLRDTLLPRLISGQLRIADAKTELEKTIA